MYISVKVDLPLGLIFNGEKAMLKCSMVFSTILTILVINFLPELMPIWMASASGTQL